MTGSRSRRFCRWRALPLLAALTFAACGGGSPVAPDDVPLTATQSFSGTLAPAGTGVYAFTVLQEGALRVTMTALNSAPLSPSTAVVRLGVGIPQGEGCAVSDSVTTTAGLTTQLLARLTPGIYCVEVRDPGVLADALSFIIRIVHS